MRDEMKGKHMHGEMRDPRYMHGEMRKGWMMMKFMKKYFTEEDRKKLAAKKLDMRIAQTEQKLEYLNMMRDMLKEKS